MKPFVVLTKAPLEQISAEKRERNFHGEIVLREELPDGPEQPDLRCSFIRFEEGAFTKLHYHTGGQVLCIVEGNGFVEFADGKCQELEQGIRVVIPPGELHRHGANPTTELEHLTITFGKTIFWEADPGRQSNLGSNIPNNEF